MDVYPKEIGFWGMSTYKIKSPHKLEWCGLCESFEVCCGQTVDITLVMVDMV